MAHKQPSIAIVHDWLYGGGAEKVIEQLHQMYPEAPIYTAFCSPLWRKRLDYKVITGYLNRWPFNRLHKFLPLLHRAWFRSLDLSVFDVVISSTGNGQAKHLRLPKTTRHICYCHTPTHYYWRFYNQYLQNPGLGPFNFIIRLGLKSLIVSLRKADFAAAQKVDFFIANSRHIKADIKKYYNRAATVIYPPVEINRFLAAADTRSKQDYFISLGRLVPAKKFDLIIEACAQENLPLRIVGRGAERSRLQKLITKLGVADIEVVEADDQQLAELLAGARGFIFASFEDFGIAPIEALASGTPLVALQAGGALDYVNAETGRFFEHQTSQSLVQALADFRPSDFKTSQLQAAARQFSTAHFRQKFKRLI